ncbi:MAG TPA: PDZ domain-containing protein [Gemmatimonadales bacterium]|nr:PDZ domain-containing protein [Gemmatimonadales bacterium]
MSRALWAVALSVIMASPLTGQERDDVRRLERARPDAVEIDSVVRQYVQFLEFRRAYLGLTVNTRASDSDSIGALIHSVSPNGPADHAGLHTGDIITSLAGESLLESVAATRRTPNASPPGLRLIELAARFDPGDTVRVVFRRGADTKRADIVTAAPPFYVRTWRTPDGAQGYVFGTDTFNVRVDSINGLRGFLPRLETLRGLQGRADMAFFPPLFEFELAPLNPGLAEYFGTSDGVLVISVPAGSKLNLKGGDVVLAVGDRRPTNPSHLLRILQSYDAKEPIPLTIMRKQRRLTITGSLEAMRR